MDAILNHERDKRDTFKEMQYLDNHYNECLENIKKQVNSKNHIDKSKNGVTMTSHQ